MNDKRQQMLTYFRNVALQENQKNQKVSFQDLLDNTGRKRYLLVIKESIGDIFIATSLFESIKATYPDHDLYIGCDPQYFELMDGNPFVHKCVPYIPAMESEVQMTGMGAHKGFFDAYCHLTVSTQRHLNYLSRDNIALDLKPNASN